MCDGLCSVLVPPSPNVQAHDEIDPVDESANWHENGMYPLRGDPTKLATGAATAMTYPVRVWVFGPLRFVVVRVTVYVPAYA